MLKKAFVVLTSILWVILIPAPAAPLLPQEVPQPLRPWVDWVRYEARQTQKCPQHYNQKDQYQCQWPSRLEININAKHAQFTQIWHIYHQSWVTLPGDKDYWPQKVMANQSAIMVTERDERPSVLLPAGQITLQGQFDWQRPPEYLPIPAQTGIVDLTIDDQKVTIPQLDAQGRLWLHQQGRLVAEHVEENRLELQVYRHIIDSIPLQMRTQIELNVAGHHREVLLGPVLLAQHIAMALDSPLPARLEPTGHLRVQVRPGNWSLTVRSRHPEPVAQLKLPAVQSSAHWVSEEIWVFEAQPQLRWVELSGVAAINPQQTTLPEDWQHLPTYRVQAGETMEFNEKRRGNPQPAADELELTRHFWLDFDGQGYSIQDHIQGHINRSWRLEMAPPIRLGRVAIADQNQLITQLDTEKNTAMGVEVRQGQIELVAESRLESAVYQLPAVGWQHQFDALTAFLHLPPGWRLLAVGGADEVPHTWIKQWSLLDLFLVLLIATAVGRLWRWWWGLLALFTLVLIYQESEAPRWIWLNILIAIALLRVLPPSSGLSKLIRGYRNLSLIVLLAIALPFIQQHVWQSGYPHLDQHWSSAPQWGWSAGYNHIADERNLPPSPTAAAKPAAKNEMLLQNEMPFQEEAEIQAQTELDLKPTFRKKIYNYAQLESKQARLVQIDPAAQVQTGPGLPQWQGQQITLRWQGPVTAEQGLQLWLLSPTMNRVLEIIRVILLAGLVVFFIKVCWAGPLNRFFKPNTMQTIILLGMMFLLPLGAHAERKSLPTQEAVQFTPESSHYFPPQYLLDELQHRLLAPPECLPHCASSPRLFLELTPTHLQGRMEIHSYLDAAVPLPGSVEHWLAQQVMLNGAPATGLLRDHSGYLWLRIPPGIHQVQFQGPLPQRHTVQLALPLTPHAVTVEAKGWNVAGVHERGVADEQLQFTRQQKDKVNLSELETAQLPPFVSVERTLLLGLDWHVETRVIRQTPLGSAVVLEIPLLDGESVISEHLRVDEDKALVHLGPQETELQWRSVFAKQHTIHLTAPQQANSNEIWRLDISAIWHVTFEGIAPIHHQLQGRRLPEWRPWPGETVTLLISRPAAVTGPIMTITQSRLQVKPGLRSCDYTLSYTVRSSRGTQQILTLPQDVQLQKIKI
ncbi:MAG: hypothetical protein SVR94_06635, partial [Pseudomonadota bacterium]|nr:hypothetical protein [Pseudomonadota bacterium]